MFIFGSTMRVCNGARPFGKEPVSFLLSVTMSVILVTRDEVSIHEKHSSSDVHLDPIENAEPISQAQKTLSVTENSLVKRKLIASMLRCCNRGITL